MPVWALCVCVCAVFWCLVERILDHQLPRRGNDRDRVSVTLFQLWTYVEANSIRDMETHIRELAEEGNTHTRIHYPHKQSKAETTCDQWSVINFLQCGWCRAWRQLTRRWLCRLCGILHSAVWGGTDFTLWPSYWEILEAKCQPRPARCWEAWLLSPDTESRLEDSLLQLQNM